MAAAPEARKPWLRAERSVAGHVVNGAEIVDVEVSELAGLVRSRRRGLDEAGPDVGKRT